MFSPAYGDLGFNNAEELKQRVSDIHMHNDPIDPGTYAHEVVPWQAHMAAFFEPSIRDLQRIIGTFAIQQIETSSEKQKLSGVASNITNNTFHQLKSLANSNSGNWSDVVDLLSLLHISDF